MSRTAAANTENDPPRAEDPGSRSRGGAGGSGSAGGSPRRSKLRWSFWNVPFVVLFLVCVGHAVGHMLAAYPPKLAFQELVRGDVGRAGRTVGALFTMMSARDWLFTAFLGATIGFVWMEREGVKRFFRSMYTGTSLVILTTIAIGVGVLVPQIDGFEDPEQRVDLEREYEKYRLYKEQGYLAPEQTYDGHNNYKAFRWAEGYFLYHMLHLYGIGMPEPGLMPQMEEGLQRFGKRYGPDEEHNRRKAMTAAVTGQAKTREISAWIREHEDFLWRFFRVSTVLDLNRTYKSNWFASLLVLLAISIGLNSLKGGPKRWLTIEKLGYNFAHTGLLVMLAGGLISNLGTDRGLLELDLRDPEPEDTYLRHFDPRKQARMPFGLGLEHFARKEWKALEVYFEGDSFTSRVPRYTLWPGRTIDLDYVAEEGSDDLRPRLRLVVEGLHDRAVIGRPLVTESAPGDDPQPVRPLAVLTKRSMRDGRLVEEKDWLSPTFPDPGFVDPYGQWRLRSAFGLQQPRTEFPTQDGVLGQLFVALSDQDVQPFGYDLPLDGVLELQGGYTVRVLDATKNFRVERGPDGGSPKPVVDPRPLAQQPLGVPAVRVEITGPDGMREPERWLIDGIDPLEHSLQKGYVFEDLVLWLAWDSWTSPGPPRYVLHWGPDNQVSLLSEDGEQTEPALGGPLSLPGPTQVVLEEVMARPRIDKNIEFLPPAAEGREDGWDPDFYSREPRGLELVAIHEPGTDAQWTESFVMATSEEFGSSVAQSLDGSFVVSFLENTDGFPFEWRSVLKVYEPRAEGGWSEVDTGSKSQREIRVNDYFYHRGYRFFQTNADPQRPYYSGIGVVYDPGIPIVLTGMYIIIAGTVVAFLIRPVVLRRRRLRSAT